MFNGTLREELLKLVSDFNGILVSFLGLPIECIDSGLVPPPDGNRKWTDGALLIKSSD